MVPVGRHTLYSSRLLFFAPRPHLAAMPRSIPTAPPGRAEHAPPAAAAAAAQRLSRGQVLAPPTGGRSAVFSTAATSNGTQASVHAGRPNVHSDSEHFGLQQQLLDRSRCRQATAQRPLIGDISCRRRRSLRSSTIRRSRCSPSRRTGRRYTCHPSRRLTVPPASRPSGKRMAIISSCSGVGFTKSVSSMCTAPESSASLPPYLIAASFMLDRCSSWCGRHQCRLSRSWQGTS